VEVEATPLVEPRHIPARVSTGLTIRFACIPESTDSM
jgi:hypothetical protein